MFVPGVGGYSRLACGASPPLPASYLITRAPLHLDRLPWARRRPLGSHHLETFILPFILFPLFFLNFKKRRHFRSPRSGATVVADACSPSTNAFTSGHGLSQFLDSRDLTNSEIGVRSLTPALVHWLRTRISRWRGDAGGICFYLSTCHRAGTRGNFSRRIGWLVMSGALPW